MNVKTEKLTVSWAGEPTQIDTRNDLAARRPWTVKSNIAGSGWDVVTPDGCIVACYLSLPDACAIAACHELFEAAKAIQRAHEDGIDPRLFIDAKVAMDAAIRKATPVMAHLLSAHDFDEENFDVD